MKCIVNGLAVEYSDAGTGKVALFLHGWMDDGQTFAGLLPHLSQPLRTITVDLPGFGKSERPQTAWELSDYVTFVKAFCAKLSLDPEILVGHSFGGRIIIKGCATGVLSPKKIVLIGSAGIAKNRTTRSRLFGVVAKIGKIITWIPPFIFWREALRKKLYEKSGSNYLAAGDLKETFLSVINEDLKQYASKISVPTLLIWGMNDTETPVEDGEKLAELIQGSELVILPDAGHFVHIEKAQEVAQAMSACI